MTSKPRRAYGRGHPVSTPYPRSTSVCFARVSIDIFSRIGMALL